MKNAKLIIDGKEIEVQVSEEDFEELTTTKKTTGYERVKDGTYYYDTGYGAIEVVADVEGVKSNLNYNGANYYSNVNIANNNALADKLMRQLRRFAVEHRKEDIDWNETQYKWFIYYYYETNELRIQSVSNCSCRDFGQIYFDTKETAETAIEIFEDELLWYFTEYYDSL